MKPLNELPSRAEEAAARRQADLGAELRAAQKALADRARGLGEAEVKSRLAAAGVAPPSQREMAAMDTADRLAAVRTVLTALEDAE